MKPFLPVLAYQKIGESPKNSRLKNQWVCVKKLEKTLSFLAKHRYTFITPADLASPLAPKPVLLAFFGGYQSFYTDVFPLLQKYKARAVLFVASDTLGTYNSWQDPCQEPWQNVLTHEQLTELAQSKLVQIGTLGLTGKNLLDLPDTALAREELLESIHRLKTLHKTETCAVGFWPWAADKNARIFSITRGINLPVFTSFAAPQPPAEIQIFPVLSPGLRAQFLLWKHR